MTLSLFISLLTAIALTGVCLILITRKPRRITHREHRYIFSQSRVANNEHWDGSVEIEPLPVIQPSASSSRRSPYTLTSIAEGTRPPQ